MTNPLLPMPSKTSEYCALTLFAAFILRCILLTDFFVPRRPGMEEAGRFNAAYTYAHAGKMAFPIYGAEFADSFGIHPHLHYGILGLLLRMGLSLYVAEGLVISAISAILIVLIASSRLPHTIKLGFLLGTYSAIVLAVMFLPDHAVG